jgi:hypothetical protein
MPFEVDLVTAITIVLIGVILTIYLLILKKNGWIGEASNYRCPNPQCRKIFQVPMKVKDFSTKKVVGLACPECGYDLGSLNVGKGSNEPAVQCKPELEIRDSVSILIGAAGPRVNGGVKEPKPPVAAHPTFESEKNPIKQSTVQTASQPYVVKNPTINQEVGATEVKGRLACPTCKKEFRTPLFTLEYAGSTPKLIKHCPYCDQPLEQQQRSTT